ncbi:unnamed protein product, partial [Laminaria digitata]
VFPEVYKAFVSKLGPINLDMDFVLSYSCIVSTDFYDHLLVATMVPVLLLLVLAGSYLIARKRNESSEPAIMRVILHKHQAASVYIALFFYSPATYKIFQTFSCDELDDGNSYLRADYSLSCLTSRHGWYEVYSLVMVGVYPVGIAAVFAGLLGWRRHDLVNPDRQSMAHLKPFNPVWVSYKKSRYYYEVVECGRRVAMTGIAVLLLPNSTAQLSAVVVFAVGFVFISEMISPFEKGADMNLYRWGNGTVVASMYVALLMNIDVARDDTPAMLTFSGVLVLANVFMIVTVLLQTAFMLK